MFEDNKFLRFIKMDEDLYPCIRVGERSSPTVEFELSCGDNKGSREAYEAIISELWSRITTVSDACKKNNIGKRRYIVTYRFGDDVDRSMVHNKEKGIYHGFYSVTAIPLEAYEEAN